MEASFWHEKWEKHQIAFHESEGNALLITHFSKLNLAKGRRVFLPLCGKTRDFAWLLANGYRVVGAELSEIAIKELFDELGVVSTKTKLDELVRYSAMSIDVFVGDIFNLTVEILGQVDAIYDRAALVALPATMRKQYTAILKKLTATAPQLLITFEYEQPLMEGPPFSITAEELRQYYATSYQLQSVASQSVVGGLKGVVVATETVWLLQGKAL